jgi:hypothetical protein
MVALGEFLAKPNWYGDNFAKSWPLLKNPSHSPGNNVIVAVLDTGYTPHPNFINNLQPLSLPGKSFSVIPYGYNFISDCRTSGECPPCTVLNMQINHNIRPMA